MHHLPATPSYLRTARAAKVRHAVYGGARVQWVELTAELGGHGGDTALQRGKAVVGAAGAASAVHANAGRGVNDPAHHNGVVANDGRDSGLHY